MGWGEIRRAELFKQTADNLAESVRRWISTPSTGNGFKMEAALERYDSAKEAIRKADAHARNADIQALGSGISSG